MHGAPVVEYDPNHLIVEIRPTQRWDVYLHKGLIHFVYLGSRLGKTSTPNLFVFDCKVWTIFLFTNVKNNVFSNMMLHLPSYV